MIRLERAALPPATAAYLERQTAAIEACDETLRRATSDTRWRNKSAEQFAVVRQALRDMCSGHARCMYCEDSHATDIDHFEPRSRAPERAFDWRNYLASCSHCNSNEKRAAYPTSDGVGALLVDPTAEDPRDHIAYSPTTGEYAAVAGSPKGAPTIATFGINRSTLPAARRDAWILLECAIAHYAVALGQGDTGRADRIRRAATRHQFAGVLHALIAAATGPLASCVDQSCRRALARHPEVSGWL